MILFTSSFQIDNHFPINNDGKIQNALNPCDNGPDTIKVTLPDSLHIVWAKLFWRKYSNPWDSLTMARIGNYWVGIIYLNGPATYSYYVKFMDSLNRIGTMPSGAPANYYSFIAGPDTVKPVITHTPLGNSPKASWPVTVNALVIDNCGIDSVWVRWKKNSSNYKQFKLISTSGNIYSAPFNSVNADVNPGDTIRYRIISLDLSTYHNSDSTALYNFRIIPSIGISINTSYIPEKFQLFQNYPNPFNPVTRISFEIPKTGFVSLKIYDILGKSVISLVNEMKTTGKYSVDYNASGLPSRIYFYRMECNGFIETKRMILLK